MFWCLPLLLVGMDPALTDVVSLPGSVGSARSTDEARTQNFLVRGPGARQVAAQCETLRSQFVMKWLTSSECQQWHRPCVVVIHCTKGAYATAVGTRVAGTSGSSTLESEAGDIVHRRIDVLLNSTGEATALAHELTHVVLADLFDPSELPMWANEGLAMLADSIRKRALHLRDCRLAVTTGGDFHLRSLVTLRQFHQQRQVAPFYGQSLSLTTFLLTKSDERHFIKFVERASRRGYDNALRECYSIAGLDELDMLWREHHLNNEAAADDG